MSEILFYGIDETGRAKFCERLRWPERSTLHAIARERLHDWSAVEIWDGPCCVVRMQRGTAPPRRGSNARLSR